jgi:hypothetical protein
MDQLHLPRSDIFESVATLEEFWVVASVVLDPSIGPLESLVAATIRATE